MASTFAVDHMTYPPILANNGFCSSLMKFINFFAGALVATAAANVLPASDAHAGFPPNGWTQVGKSCKIDNNDTSLYVTYYKLRKNSDQSAYGVNRNKTTWVVKNVSLSEANAKMNYECQCDYRPCDY
tara:strand:- start:56 stop:439 length:384 start_codon:yes stop_codon:yes gene_type:complete